jgi:MtfA peptidase
LDYDATLARYNPYYKSLPDAGRDRFLRRVLEFMQYKNFEYIDIGTEERMPLLISAAAVQLTYGLEEFHLDYFRNIYILKDKYSYGLSNTPFEGHAGGWAHPPGPLRFHQLPGILGGGG